MLGFLTLKPKAFGLDMADASLKIAQLEKKGEHFRLASFGDTKLDKGVIEAGEVKKKDVLVKSVQRVMESVQGKKISTKYVVASLPEEKAFLQVVKLPRMSEEQVANAIRVQAENYIPYPVETVYLDFAIISPFHNHIDHLDVLLASLPRETVDAYTDVLKSAGLIPVALEIESLALSRAVVENGVTPVPLLLVDMGIARSKLSIFSGYSLRFTTSLAVSSKEFTDAIAKTLHVDEEKAEEFKRSYGLDSKEQAIGEEVFNAIVPPATDFVEQVKKYLDYYETHIPHQHLGEKQKKIKKVVLCGGGANLRGFPEFLTRALKVEVVVGNPWVNILSPDSKELPALPFHNSLRYTTALGLALRGA
jgi:type IV pilus assembly protein PilM